MPPTAVPTDQTPPTQLLSPIANINTIHQKRNPSKFAGQRRNSEEHGGENPGKRRGGGAVPVAAAGGGAVRHRRHHVRVGPVPPPRLLGAAAGAGLQRRGPHHARVRDDAHGRAQQRADRPLPVPGLAAGPGRRLLRREGGPLRAVRAPGAPRGARAGRAVPVGGAARDPKRRGHQRAQAQRQAHDRRARALGVLPGCSVRRGVRRGEVQAGPRRVPPRAGAARRGRRPGRRVRGLRDWDPGWRRRGDAGGGDRGGGPGGEDPGRRRVARRQGLPRRQALGGAGGRRCCCCRRRSRGGWWGTERGLGGACRSRGELSWASVSLFSIPSSSSWAAVLIRSQPRKHSREQVS